MTKYNSTVCPLAVCSLLLTIAASPARSFADQKTVNLNPKIVSAFIQDHCQKCHGPNKQEGELRLDTLSLQIGNHEHAQRWQDVILAIEGEEMPPEDARQPPRAERTAVVAHLKATLPRAKARSGPGYQYKAGDIEIVAASADEPKAESFGQDSILAAAKYLEDGAIAWTRSRKCITCHTNGTYMVERPSLTAYFGKPSEEVLRLFQRDIPTKAAAPEKGRQRPAYRLIWQTLGLAQWDKHVTKETSNFTNRALRSMIMQQRDDGSWINYTGVRELPHISTDFELAVRAAWAISAAPGWLDKVEDEDLLGRIERMKTYLREHKPRNDYELALKLQLANFMPDTVSAEHRREAIAMLRSKQQADGGWSTRSMSAIDNWANWHPQKDKRNLDMLHAETEAEKSASDPYMTGFAIVLLRESGIPKTDEQIQRGITWLKTNQRQSGRWWMKSMFKDTYHFSTYMGTAQALKALGLCGELDSLKLTTVPSTALSSTDRNVSN